jgi:hypothetical protein
VIRIRLISLFAVTLALAGGAAGPSRMVESTRLLASICRLDDGRQARPEARHRLSPALAAPAAPAEPKPGALSRAHAAPLDDALFQRPPPLRP